MERKYYKAKRRLLLQKSYLQTNTMKRENMLAQLNKSIHWDIIIIGGGATGLGAAVDAATRGYKTLLLEQEDFAKGTSSRSTKLIHGGVRYLTQGNIKLVMGALRERGLLLKNACHVCSELAFIIPVYKRWHKFYYGLGLKIYDLLAGNTGLERTKIISTEKTLQLLPAINKKNLCGGIIYEDGQFDDARLAINLAQTAAAKGATILNYCGVTSFIKDGNKIKGVVITDKISQKQYRAEARVVVNATGVFTDKLLKIDNPAQPSLISPSQGVHLIIDGKKFPGPCAMMIPKTSDGRVLFAVPWHEKVVVGTTDAAVENISAEPQAMENEVNFILNNLNKYLSANITKADVLSVFAGLRPLIKNTGAKKSSLMPRDHSILISGSGLVSITGGKWTIYRQMGEEVIDKAASAAGLNRKDCVTRQLKIHGCTANPIEEGPLSYYGSDLGELDKLYSENESWRELIHPDFPYTKACVIWAVRNEMAMTAEDVLARRTRMLFLDAKAAICAAPTTARLMAEAMNEGEAWITTQINSFINLAQRYCLTTDN
jgi:glycerol-3-phosphate dehydrogenase